jgi:predicted transcriptional regulator
MTVRIPTDEKDMLQAIADHADVTLSGVVVRAVRDFIDAHSGSLKKGAAKAKARPMGF